MDVANIELALKRKSWHFEKGAHAYVFHGAFWNQKQRAGSSIHEVPYRACFKPELPGFFAELFLDVGSRVYDPFMGRGTTVVEAALRGHEVAGNDANPLSEILTRPRLEVPDAADILSRLGEIDLESCGAEPSMDLSMFYSENTLRQLLNLRSWLNERRALGDEDSVDRWIRMAATTRLSGHSKGFFSVRTMPPNVAVSPDRQRKLNKKHGLVPPDRDVKSIIWKKTISLRRTLDEEDVACLRKASTSSILTCVDAARNDSVADESVDLVVTSPPFLDVVDYNADNWLRNWFNGISERETSVITVTPSIESWRSMMRDVLTDVNRVLREGGVAAIEVGEVRNSKVLLDEIVAPAGIEAGLSCAAILVNDQRFTKTSNCWGVENNKRGTNTNRVVLFVKE